MSTLNDAMDYLADHSGIETTSVSAPSSFSSGTLYLVKDHTTHTVRGHGYINKTSNIASSETLFTIPDGYRPASDSSGSAWIATSLSTPYMAYRISISAAGVVRQTGTSYARALHLTFEYEYAGGVTNKFLSCASLYEGRCAA